MFIYIPDAVYSEKTAEKHIVQRALHDVRGALQAALVDDFLQIRREAVGVDVRKEEATRLAVRQDVDELLQPEGLFALEGSAVFFVGGDVPEQRFS